MALTDEQIETEIEQLERAMGSTVQSVAFADRSQTNVNTDEMLSRLSYLRGVQRRRAGRQKQIRLVGGNGF